MNTKIALIILSIVTVGLVSFFVFSGKNSATNSKNVQPVSVATSNPAVIPVVDPPATTVNNEPVTDSKQDQNNTDDRIGQPHRVNPVQLSSMHDVAH